MNRWAEINCRTDCGRCNHKGTPSNMKGSKSCLQLRKEISSDKEDSFSFMSFFKMMFKNKGSMRQSGKTHEQNKKEKET